MKASVGSTPHPFGAHSVTKPETPSPHELDTVRQLLFGAEVRRLEEQIVADREAAAAHLQDLERRVGERVDELARRVTAQLDDLSRRQQQHADRVTQLLDQVMAQLGQRVDTLVSETRTRLDELQQRSTELERRKLSVADFGATLASLGQRFSEGGKGTSDAG
jgi:DNA repair exonuclease SbcCD ATPase subunit